VITDSADRAQAVFVAAAVIHAIRIFKNPQTLDADAESPASGSIAQDFDRAEVFVAEAEKRFRKMVEAEAQKPGKGKKP
jgi:hypothetical protein